MKAGVLKFFLIFVCVLMIAGCADDTTIITPPGTGNDTIVPPPTTPQGTGGDTITPPPTTPPGTGGDTIAPPPTTPPGTGGDTIAPPPTTPPGTGSDTIAPPPITPPGTGGDTIAPPPPPPPEVEITFTTTAPVPTFREVTVHDPSVTRVGNRWWVFGSHLASAHSDDLLRWTQYSTHVVDGNPLIPNVFSELHEALTWANTTTLWAGDVIQLRETGTFHFYYSACEGTSPRSALGLATSSNIGGPYTHQQILLRSGMWGEVGADGRIYDPNIHPNAIDPHVFYDSQDRLWMVYGSFSGGIFILQLDPRTGLILPNQGWGTRLTGGNHARIEGPYILYSPESNYYYLFLTFGGLSADGGYNIRVARSRTPDGPYFDPQGNNMLNCRGPAGSFFDDVAIAPFGGKMMGNFRFTVSNIGYVSPGHNSASFDASQNKYYLFTHTRFPSRGEVHNVRVHQMFLNSQGWFVISPHRYAGETMQNYSNGEIAGNFQLVIFQRTVSADIRESVPVHFSVAGAITGAASGQWRRTDGNRATVTINSTDYYGVFVHNWDAGLGRFVITFSGMSNSGLTIFASQVIQ